MASKTTLQAVDDPSLTFDPIKVGGDVVLAQHAEVIRALGKRVVHDVIEIGRRLTDAKARCGHGNWLPWLEREFGWSDSTALRYMQAHQFATDKSVTVTDLSLKSLYLLAAPSTPEAARDEVIERSEAGEHLTPAQIKETIDKAVNAEIEAKLQTVRRARITEQSVADVLGDAPHQATVVSEWLAQYAASAKPTVPLVPPDNTDPSERPVNP